MELIRVNATPDLLAHKNRRAVAILADYSYDEGVLQVLGEKKSLVIFVSLDQLLKSRGIARSKLLYKLRNFLALCARFGVLFVLGFEEDIKTSPYALRGKDEIVALGQLLGLNRGQAKMAVKRFDDLFARKV
ncbi:MAG: hypothetical protein QXT45_03040 [Candidatus Bilamarchaeaceae archaeon]